MMAQKNPIVTITMEDGSIMKAELYPDIAPESVNNFISLTQDTTLVALYGITRGNRRAYLHVEQLDASAPLADLLPTSATLLRELKSTGELDFPALGGDPDDTWLTLISRGLNLDATLRVSLTGPTAEAWRQALVDKGVRAARMEIGTGDAKGLHLHLIR